MVDRLAPLRAINVGPKNKLHMAGPVTVFEEAGCEHGRTYI